MSKGSKYRPDLSNLIGNRYTIWKLEDFSATQILREINFCHFETQETAILFWPFEQVWIVHFLGTFDIFKSETFPNIKIQNLQEPELISRKSRVVSKIAKFPYCGISTVKNPN